MLSIFYLFFFFIRQLPSKLAECNSTKIGHVFGSECILKMYDQDLWYPPLKTGAPKPPIFNVFWRLCS